MGSCRVDQPREDRRADRGEQKAVGVFVAEVDYEDPTQRPYCMSGPVWISDRHGLPRFGGGLTAHYTLPAEARVIVSQLRPASTVQRKTGHCCMSSPLTLATRLASQ